jgi:Domain of unknown function (DUF4157)
MALPQASPGTGLPAQRKAAPPAEHAHVHSEYTLAVLQAAGLQGTLDEPARLPGHGGGAEMPDAVRAKMERSFGADFSQVRVHEGPHVAGLGALAYTQGTDIHFAPGQYQPESQHGQALLGHELTHVVQQSQGRVAATRQAKGVRINDDAALEREADELGARAARGEPVDANAAAAPRHVVLNGTAAAPMQRFGLLTGVELQGPIQASAQAAELSANIAAWLDPMQTAAELRQARLDVEAAQAGAPFHLRGHDMTMDEPHRAVLADAVRRRLMARVVAVRAPFQPQLASTHDAAARRALQDQMRAAARPFLDELRDPAQPAARFSHGDPAVQREVLAALTLDGEGHAEDELADQAANGDAGPRARARSVGHLPEGAWCGAFTYAQQRGAGLSEAARSSMHATGPHEGIDAFLDYEHRRQVIWTGTTWQLVRAYHAERNSPRTLVRLPRTPTPVTAGSVYAPGGLDLQPGDIVLIDNFRGTYADHITECRSYDPATGQLETIAGNEGASPGHVAASATPRDLNANPEARTVVGYHKPSRVYAYGRFSIVDYEVHTYLPSMPRDPLESPEAMAARQHGGRHGGHSGGHHSGGHH